MKLESIYTIYSITGSFFSVRVYPNFKKQIKCAFVFKEEAQYLYILYVLSDPVRRQVLPLSLQDKDKRGESSRGRIQTET
jgi:hypothetical protein